MGNLEQNILEVDMEVNKQNRAVEDIWTGDSLVGNISVGGNLVLDILTEDTLEDSVKKNKQDTLEDN